MKFLVTGGRGFIGSHFVELVLAQGHSVVDVDKMTYASRRFHNDVETHKIDIGLKDQVKWIVEHNQDAYAIINFAAETHVDNSISESDPFVQTNIQGTKNILDMVNKYKIPRLIHISTDEVYGHIKQGEVKAFDEEDELRPRNPYSASKAGADMMCLAYHNTYKTPVIITRTCNNYGIAQHEEKMLPKFVKLLCEGKSMTLYGNGEQMREWIWVNDNCRAINLVLEKGELGEVYNIGSGNDYTNYNIAKLIAKYHGTTENYIKYVADRPGHDFRYKINYDKITTLGFDMQYKFEDKLEEVVEWYKDAYTN